MGGLGSVSFRLPFFGVSFGIVGWVGGRGGLDGLVSAWVSVDLVAPVVVVICLGEC